MQKLRLQLASCLFGLGLIALCLGPALPARADDVPGCTEADLSAALSIGGIVTFTQDCSITITGPLSILSDTTLDGQGYKVSISGGNQVLVFEVRSPAHFTVDGLTISGGNNTNGGAFYVRAGGSLVLTNCTLTANAAAGTNGVAGIAGGNNSIGNGSDGRSGTAGSAGFGGAIYNLGTTFLQNCNIVTNSATGGNGGAGGKGGDGAFNAGNGGSGAGGGGGFGGAIYNTGSLIISNCNILGNTIKGGSGGAGGPAGSAPFGGRDGAGGAGGGASGAGVFSSGGTVTVVNSTFANNTAQAGDSAAGGVVENGNGTSGFKGGDTFGGGLYISSGTVTNSTFFNNVITGGAGGAGGNGRLNAGNGGNGGSANGGGLFNTGVVTIVNCTFANCSAIGGTNGLAGTGLGGVNGSIGTAKGGGVANGTGSMTLRNSILSTNLAGQNASGTIVDAGNNISSDSTPSSLTGSSRKKLDPRIGTLADNGGPTLTVALATNSPAVDALGTNAANFPPTDQRGVSRGLGKGADIGAFELVTLPAILTQPASQTLTNGESAVFTVTAVGDRLSYRWRFGGTNIAGALSSSYSIPAVTITNAGVYDVVITNIFGAITSAPAILSLSPYFTLQPTNIDVSVGQSVTFNTAVSGTGPLSYQWYFDETQAIAVATSTNYTLTNVQTNDGGTYSLVVASPDFGSVTSALATLTVDVAPQIIVDLTNQTVAVGKSVTFVVAATGTAPLSYQWEFNGSAIGVSGPSYTFNALTGDAGTYAVRVNNSVGSVRSSVVTLTVLTGPSIIQQPQNVAVIQGQPALFTVTATGGTLTYQWTFNGASIAGATNSTYQIASTQTSMAGNYAVIVTDQFGSVTSSTALLIVGVPPGISVQPKSQTVAEGSTVTLSVTATGTPPLSYQWRFYETNSIIGATAPSYTFSARKSDAGSYDVVVNNLLGASRSDAAVLRVMDAIEITGLTLSSNNLSFAFNTEASFVYEVQYKKALGDTNWNQLQSPIIGSGASVTVVDPLTNFPTRFYRIVGR